MLLELLFLATMSSAGAAEPAPVMAEPTRPATRFALVRDLREGLVATLDKQNQLTIAVAVPLVVGAHQADPSARDAWGNQRRIGDWDRLGNEVLGTGVPGTLLAGGAWIWGEKTARVREVHFGQASLEALLVTSLATTALKVSIGRERPDASNRQSFPSGHTSTMAATAMTLQEFYGWKAGAPAFALTAFTGLSRMSADRHWFSDTVAGAALGILVAHGFSRAHLERLNAADEGHEAREAASRFSIAPLIGPETSQLIFVIAI